jgi:hypothetical protein
MPEQFVPDRSSLFSKDDVPVALAGVAITADVEKRFESTTMRWKLGTVRIWWMKSGRTCFRRALAICPPGKRCS